MKNIFKPARVAYSPEKRIKIPLYENLMDIQFFKRKSYQQKIRGNVEFSIGCGKMLTEYSQNFYSRFFLN